MELVYYDPARPGSLSGVLNLTRYSGQPRHKVQKFLAGQETYSMHKPVRRKFPRRKTFSKGINDLFQADIVDVSNVSNYNDRKRYILTCIDVFSKYAWAVSLSTKSANDVARAFENHVLSERKCAMLQTDKGSEFLSGSFQNMLRNHNIHWYSSENDDVKAAVVERFNRTLKERIYRYFTYKNTRRYIDVLPDIVRAYNNTHHRSIGMAPSEVNDRNADMIARRLYPPKPKKFIWKLNIGDCVRMSRSSVTFRKGYVGGWTEEIFNVTACYPTVPVTYAVSDASGEPIKGRFYEWELQKVDKPVDGYYVIEKILKTRRLSGRVEYFVKWRGYPDSMNSWTNEVRKR